MLKSNGGVAYILYSAGFDFVLPKERKRKSAHGQVRTGQLKGAQKYPAAGCGYYQTAISKAL